ncbi:uncharacterized protein KY384_004893 [Bacidia gigantensis]|uniref:uncharacterized protein n=1 Tax=Bacidia gigantensis TaxID=2732470 RepID=UPI001D035E77|nr:uncharacterized protein KY384_004893 [Bacidia gigantensis]KAG8530391.1 hypothetical protein KY384_004893 [Bacidia gigantensis]
MPHPTGVRVLNRPSVFSNITKKSAKRNIDPEKLDHVVRTDLADPPLSRGSMDRLHSRDVRKSLTAHLPGRSSSPASKSKASPKPSPRIAPAKPARLAIEIESPPLILHGSPSHSTGALLSGQLLLTVTDPEVTIQSYEMILQGRMTTRKPVGKDCPECTTKISHVRQWNFLSEATLFKVGAHNFPFSHLLSGQLPATCHSELGRIDYFLRAEATTSLGDKFATEYALPVQRALMPGSDRNAQRVFPPTNLSAIVVLPPVIHPIGSFPVQMRLTGLVESALKDAQKRWRVRKMSWKIDETSRVVSAACSKHAHKVGGEGKGVLHEDTRTIATEDIKQGWKTDFDIPGGQIEIEFTAALNTNKQPVCDVESPNGLSSSHLLVLEIIVSEEQVSLKGAKYATPTGGARVLRMQFKIIVTERAGMGISWDEELPPPYEDVPHSPPGYLSEFQGDINQLPRIEELDLGDSVEVDSSSGRA